MTITWQTVAKYFRRRVEVIARGFSHPASSAMPVRVAQLARPPILEFGNKNLFSGRMPHCSLMSIKASIALTIIGRSRVVTFLFSFPWDCMQSILKKNNITCQNIV